jgi:hypothetical protein
MVYGHDTCKGRDGIVKDTSLQQEEFQGCGMRAPTKIWRVETM